jgi:site-specific DNA-methyltransferase (adenine-specific)
VSDWVVHAGDCLDAMRTMPSASVDAVVTDPPYGINTKSDGMGKLSPWADLCNAALWYREWIGECRRLLKPTGCLWSFLNWRSMPTFQKAACDLGWPIESMLVWDKQWIGPGGHKGLRPSYELVALWAMPDFAIDNRGVRDIKECKWAGHKPTGHPAEKPWPLCRWLLGTSRQIPQVGTPTVLDPFTGSGTTGEAAVKAGWNFIGCELDDKWADYARRRIADAVPLCAGATP